MRAELFTPVFYGEIMKLKVVGWTYDYDGCFEEAQDSFAAQAAIIDEIRANGYMFSGWNHQETENCVPVLSDGKMRCYSQRGWGGIMAEAWENGNTMGYARYAFFDNAVKAPPEEKNIYAVMRETAKEVLTQEEYDYLYEDNVVVGFPHPELGERGIYTLTDEEADKVNRFGVTRQLPSVVLNVLFPKDLRDTYTLSEEECTLKPKRITLKMRDDLRLIDAGDTVILGENTYLVQDIRQYMLHDNLMLDIIF